MDRAFLEGLGLNVREADGVLEAEIEMRSGEAMNPLTRSVIETVTFTVLGDRLIAIDPAELVGSPPILIPHLTGGAAIEDLVVKSVNDSLMHAQRRSKELSMLGFNPKTDLLAQLLALNQEVVAKEKAGEKVTPPGVPVGYGDAARLVTEDCIKP